VLDARVIAYPFLIWARIASLRARVSTVRLLAVFSITIGAIVRDARLADRSRPAKRAGTLWPRCNFEAAIVRRRRRYATLQERELKY
jgi:hypothetical protein